MSLKLQNNSDKTQVHLNMPSGAKDELQNDILQH